MSTEEVFLKYYKKGHFRESIAPDLDISKSTFKILQEWIKTDIGFSKGFEADVQLIAKFLPGW